MDVFSTGLSGTFSGAEDEAKFRGNTFGRSGSIEAPDREELINNEVVPASFHGSSFEPDVLTWYAHAIQLQESACAQECAHYLWSHWSGNNAHCSRFVSAANGKELETFPCLPGAFGKTDQPITLHRLRAMESAAWRPIPIDEAIGWAFILQAFAALDPVFATLIETWRASGHIRHINADDPLGACCIMGDNGWEIRVPHPASVQGIALLAHELGHALHEHYIPGVLANAFLTEQLAMACERWVLNWIAGDGTDLLLARAVCAWLRARDAEFMGRHAMLSRFEAAMANLMRKAFQPAAAEVINHLWLEYNRQYFGSNVVFPSSFSSAWTQVQPLFLQPGCIGEYAAAWDVSSTLSNSLILRKNLIGSGVS